MADGASNEASFKALPWGMMLHNTDRLSATGGMLRFYTTWTLWHELRTMRNAEVHGRDEATCRAAETDILRRRLRLVYDQRSRVEPRVAMVLDTPMEQRLARGAIYVKNWLAIHESLVHNSVRRANDRVIRGVRSLCEYFPGHIDDPG